MKYVRFLLVHFFFFTQKTAYDMRISYWSSDVCSSDLLDRVLALYCLIGWSRNRSSERRAANLSPTSNRLHLSRRNLLDCSWICPHESSQRVRSYRRKWKRHTRCYRQPLLEPQHRQYWQNQLRAREDHLPSQERYSPRVCGYCTEPTDRKSTRLNSSH